MGCLQMCSIYFIQKNWSCAIGMLSLPDKKIQKDTFWRMLPIPWIQHGKLVISPDHCKKAEASFLQFAGRDVDICGWGWFWRRADGKNTERVRSSWMDLEYVPGCDYIPQMPHETGRFTYIQHKFKSNVGKFSSPMEHMGTVISYGSSWWFLKPEDMRLDYPSWSMLG